MNFSLDPMTEVTTSRQCGLWPIWREGEDQHRESILHSVVFFARTALIIDIQPQDPQKVLTCINGIYADRGQGFADGRERLLLSIAC